MHQSEVADQAQLFGRRHRAFKRRRNEELPEDETRGHHCIQTWGSQSRQQTPAKIGEREHK